MCRCPHRFRHQFGIFNRPDRRIYVKNPGVSILALAVMRYESTVTVCINGEQPMGGVSFGTEYGSRLSLLPDLSDILPSITTTKRKSTGFWRAIEKPGES